MTDRLKGCNVVFDRDIRDDDVEPLLNAIRMMKGVLSVSPERATADDWMIRSRVKREFIEKLYNLIDEINK